MPTHEHFLAALAAEPQELGARLVYADWLEDQGDARAELIRVMEEMHALAPYSDRFWQLRPRRAQLKQGVSDEWLTALGYNVYRPLFTKMPAERLHRWRLITEFIETWHGPLGDSPGNTEEEIVAAEERLGLKLPAAMREWYALFGKRREYWYGSGGDPWCELSDVIVQSGHIRFRHHRQYFTQWGARIDDAAVLDPIVHIIDTDPRWSRLLSPNAAEAAVFSEFATSAIICSGPLVTAHMLGVVREDSREAIRRALPKSFARADLPNQFSGRTTHVWEMPDIICVDHPHANKLWDEIDFCASDEAITALPQEFQTLIDWF